MRVLMRDTPPRHHADVSTIESLNSTPRPRGPTATAARFGRRSATLRDHAWT
jgi:hypothetical protein